ncbi:restriction endonuclease subunit S [Candidatus Nitrososphaera evergladensis]|nr:restriction endonuclease subunit S [Candidatus Nitrososphaera evergladensis]
MNGPNSKPTEIGDLPEHWKVVRLEEVAEIVGGATPLTSVTEYWNGDIPFVTPTDITKLDGHSTIRNTAKRITKKGLKAISAKLIPSGSVLMTSRATIGFCAINEVPVVTNQGFATLICRDTIDNLYALHLLRSLKPQIEQLANGTTFKEVSRTSLRKLLIPLPPLPEQIVIASVLEKACRLQAKRRLINTRCSHLVDSIFFKMFGDLFSNSLGWKRVLIQDVCIQITDIIHKMPKAVDEGIPFISVMNLTKGDYIDFSDVKFISKDDHVRLIQRCRPQQGDVLYTRIGVNYGIARLVETNTEFSISYSLALLKPDRQLIHPIFLKNILNTQFVKLQADRKTRGIGVPDLGIKEIKSLEIMLPPLKLQEEFAALATKVTSIQRKQIDEYQKIDQLSKSLTMMFFSGKKMSASNSQT